MTSSACPAAPDPPAFAGPGWSRLGVAPIVAHQGGWDEILMVVAPLAVIGGLLWVANRRVTAQLEREVEGEGDAAAQADGALDSDGERLSSGDDGQD